MAAYPLPAALRSTVWVSEAVERTSQMITAQTITAQTIRWKSISIEATRTKVMLEARRRKSA